MGSGPGDSYWRIQMAAGEVTEVCHTSVPTLDTWELRNHGLEIFSMARNCLYCCPFASQCFTNPNVFSERSPFFEPVFFLKHQSRSTTWIKPTQGVLMKSEIRPFNGNKHLGTAPVDAQQRRAGEEVSGDLAGESFEPFSPPFKGEIPSGYLTVCYSKWRTSLPSGNLT